MALSGMADTAGVQHSEVQTSTAYRASLQQKLPELQPGESMAAYSARVGRALDLKQCRMASAIEQPGLYLYKRPVRGDAGKLLHAAGSVFHHIVLYVKAADQSLVALEMGPQGNNDVADNIFESVEAGPILCHAAAAPDDGARLLHIDAPHHPLSYPAIQKAIEFAQQQQYHTVHSNCIQFADYMVRLLTGGAMFGASLAHDALCGNVPPVDSPLLGFLAMMQLSWLHVCDGSRLMAQFLAQHEPPPPLAAPLLLLQAPAEPTAAAAAAADQPAPPSAAPAAAAAGASADYLPDFLSAALSAARSRGGGAQPLLAEASGAGPADGASSGTCARDSAPAGGAAFNPFGAANGDANGAPVGGLSDLIGSVLAAAGSMQNGGGGSSGMASLLSATLAGGPKTVVASGASAGAAGCAAGDVAGVGAGDAAAVDDRSADSAREALSAAPGCHGAARHSGSGGGSHSPRGGGGGHSPRVKGGVVKPHGSAMPALTARKPKSI